ncbi:MAG: fumarate hydratase [Methanophagales archaeon]|nr:fumarate hydratase [Methanophagales archaeon]
MITKELIKEVTITLLKRAETGLPGDVKAALVRAYEREDNKIAKVQLEAMLDNVKLAGEMQRPLCQDTGLPLFFVTLGSGTGTVDPGDIDAGIREGVEAATDLIPLRSNVVDPITRAGKGGNIGDKMPYIDYTVDPALDLDFDGIELLVSPKGGGAENMSALTMLTPKPEAEAVKEIQTFVLETVLKAAGKPCPPTIIGIGLGGSADIAMKLAKVALLRPVGVRNKVELIAQAEEELLEAVNKTGIGPMGLGGKTTALGLHIETASTHIASFPVAIAFQCWAARKSAAKIYGDGRVEYR